MTPKARPPKLLLVFAATPQMFYNWCAVNRITPTDSRVRFMSNPVEQFRGYHPDDADLLFLLPEEQLPAQVRNELALFRSLT